MEKNDNLEKYNEIAKAGAWQWSKVGLDELPATTREYVQTWLASGDIEFVLHKPIIDGVYVFKIDVPPVYFLVHNPMIDGHIWGDASFDDLENNTALAWIVNYRDGRDVDKSKTWFDAYDRQLIAASN